MTDIRVGLTEVYGNKKIITFYNNSVCLGYCKSNVYSATESLFSLRGFTFEADNNSYSISSETYSSLNQALSKCNEFNSEDASFPAVLASGKWKIYTLSSENNSGSKLIRVTGSDYSFILDPSESGCYPQFKPIKDKYISLGSRRYRGRIEIVRELTDLTAVNIVNIEAYLIGVVTSEMSANAPKEALFAQAICSRSYAAAKAGFSIMGNAGDPYILTDNDSSQVYKGVNGETQAALEAVFETQGKVLYNNGNIVEAFYFSTSGGSTDSISDIWNIKNNVFTKVFDRYETNPECKPWIIDYTLKELSEILNSKGYDIGDVLSVNPLVITEGGRVYSLKIKGSKDNIEIKGNSVRTILKLPGTKFKVLTSDCEYDKIYTISSEGTLKRRLLKGAFLIDGSNNISVADNSLKCIICISDDNMTGLPLELPESGVIRFIGTDNGHGVGMSQSGAIGMAEKGFKYSEILEFYYKNITIGQY